MRELMEKLERAEAGSRELGHEVLLRCGWHRSLYGHFYGPLYQWFAPDRKPCLISGDEDKLPNPTTSLDAALALAERVLPSWRLWTWRAEKDDRGFYAALWTDPDFEPEGCGRALTPALALCIAILRALRTTEQHAQPTPQQEER